MLNGRLFKTIACILVSFALLISFSSAQANRPLTKVEQQHANQLYRQYENTPKQAKFFVKEFLKSHGLSCGTCSEYEDNCCPGQVCGLVDPGVWECG